MQRLTTDVLVLGGGAAGLAAAVAAAQRGVSVVLATVLGPLTSATVWSDASFEMEGGVGSAFALPAHPEDNVERFYGDLLATAHGLGDERVLGLLAERALPTAQWLEGLGARFRRDAQGRLQVHPAPGHSLPRLCAIQPRTGTSIVRVLRASCRRLGVITVEARATLGLLRLSERVAGCRVSLGPGSDPLEIISGATVLATGGVSALYPYHTSPRTNVGDGLWLAWQAGADLVDLEFHAPMLVTLVRGRAFGLATVAFRRGRFRDLAEIVLRHPRYAGLRPWVESTAPGLPEPMGEWRLEPGPAALAEFAERFPNTMRYFRRHGVDPQQGVPVSLAGHYVLGGVRVDEHMATSVRGLFAAGELAGNFLGASRLVGTGISTALITGQVAGETAAEAVLSQRRVTAGRLQAAGGEQVGAERVPRLDPSDRQELRWILHRLALVRDEATLKAALQAFETAGNTASSDESPEGGYASPSLLLYGRLHVAGALERRESRGEHLRTDYPAPDPALQRHTVAAPIQ